VQPSAIESASIRRQPADSTDIWSVISAAERLGALLLLLITLPLLVSAGVAVFGLSGKSPFIAHRRVGLLGQSFWILKLRTMWDDNRGHRWRLVERLHTPTNGGPTLKLAKDPRVTNAFAAACRRFSIDELPQLWQVVRGEMALVGPRPLTKEELEAHYGPDAAEVLSRKPGMSGLWQVCGRSRLSYRQRRRLDLFLIRKWSGPLYLWILRATLTSVVKGQNAW
jgi:exopolysaccharide production protein ExoY